MEKGLKINRIFQNEIRQTLRKKKDKKKVHDILPPWESKIDCECDESDGGGQRQIA
jgi:hypothetical protein